LLGGGGAPPPPGAVQEGHQKASMIGHFGGVLGGLGGCTRGRAGGFCNAIVEGSE
jgi:hypothetical protein